MRNLFRYTTTMKEPSNILLCAATAIGLLFPTVSCWVASLPAAIDLRAIAYLGQKLNYDKLDADGKPEPSERAISREAAASLDWTRRASVAVHTLIFLCGVCMWGISVFMFWCFHPDNDGRGTSRVALVVCHVVGVVFTVLGFYLNASHRLPSVVTVLWTATSFFMACYGMYGLYVSTYAGLGDCIVPNLCTTITLGAVTHTFDAWGSDVSLICLLGIMLMLGSGIMHAFLMSVKAAEVFTSAAIVDVSKRVWCGQSDCDRVKSTRDARKCECTCVLPPRSAPRSSSKDDVQAHEDATQARRYHNEVVQPVLDLVPTINTVNERWGPSIHAFALYWGLNALGFFICSIDHPLVLGLNGMMRMAMGGSAARTTLLGIAAFWALLPLPVVLIPVSISTECVKLVGKLQTAAFHELRQCPEGTSTKHVDYNVLATQLGGVGFKLGGAVVDRDGLIRVYKRVAGLFTTLIPIIVALQPTPNVVDDVYVCGAAVLDAHAMLFAYESLRCSS